MLRKTLRPHGRRKVRRAKVARDRKPIAVPRITNAPMAGSLKASVVLTATEPKASVVRMVTDRKASVALMVHGPTARTAPMGSAGRKAAGRNGVAAICSPHSMLTTMATSTMPSFHTPRTCFANSTATTTTA